MARIAVGSNVKKGPRRGQVLKHRPQGMVDVQFTDVGFVERHQEKSLRKGNPKAESVWYLYAVSTISGETLQKAGPFYRKTALDRMAKKLRGSWKNAEIHQVMSDEPVNWFTYALGYNNNPHHVHGTVGITVSQDPVTGFWSVYGYDEKGCAKNLTGDLFRTKAAARQVAQGIRASVMEGESLDSIAKDARVYHRRYCGPYRNPAGKGDYYDQAREQFRRQQMAIYESQKKRGLSDKEAWQSSFAIATRVGQKHGWLKPGTQEPTAKGRRGAKQKLKSGDAWAKRQKYELELSKRRKSGKHRVVPQRHGKQTRYYVQPGGRYFYGKGSKKRAEALRDELNGVLVSAGADEIAEALVANPAIRENWVGTVAAVATLGDLGYRTVKSRRKKKKEKKLAEALAKAENPRSPWPYRLSGTDYELEESDENLAKYEKASESWEDESWMDAPMYSIFREPGALRWTALWAKNTPAIRQIGGIEGSVLGSNLTKKQALTSIKKHIQSRSNPRYLDERGGMSRGAYRLHSAARSKLSDSRVLGRLKGVYSLKLAQVPDSRKAHFVEARRDLERDIENTDQQFKDMLSDVIDAIPGGDYGRRTQAQKNAMRGLRGAYNEAYSEVFLERERQRAARKSRRTNPDHGSPGPYPKSEKQWRVEAGLGRRGIPPKRTKGIARAGTPDPFAQVKSPRPFQGMKPQLFEERGVYYLVYEGKSRKIPRVVGDANRAAGLKGAKWRREKTVTSRIWEEYQESASRFAIVHPASGRGSKSDPYRIFDKEKDRFLKATFTRKPEADKFLWKKQGGIRKEHIGFAGEIPITAYRTTSRSRAQYIAENLDFLDVSRTVWATIFGQRGERTVMPKKSAQRKSRKLSAREKKIQRLAEIQAELAGLKANPRRRRNTYPSHSHRDNTAHGVITRKADLRPDEDYTIWLKMGSGYVIERSYPGRYIRDAMWDDIKAFNKANTRQYVVVGHGIDPNTGYRQNYVAAIVRGATAVARSPLGKKIAIEAAVVAGLMVGEKMMKKGKISPAAMTYIQRRVEQKTGVAPSQAEVTKILKALDANKDSDLTDAEIIEAVELMRKKK